MLVARSLRTGTRGEKNFDEVPDYLEENNILLRNVSACTTTDGAPSMTGRYCIFEESYPQSILHSLCDSPSN